MTPLSSSPVDETLVASPGEVRDLVQEARLDELRRERDYAFERCVMERTSLSVDVDRYLRRMDAGLDLTDALAILRATWQRERAADAAYGRAVEAWHRAWRAGRSS